MSVFGNVGDWSQERLANWIRLTFPQLTAKAVPPSVGSGDSGRLPGEIKMWPTETAPAGHVLCDGAEYDPGDETYSALYAVLGTQFNTGGETGGYFRVPDMQGRVPVGLGAHVDVDALGDSDGAALADRRPEHTHTTPGDETSVPHHAALGAPTTKEGAGATVVTPWSNYYEAHTHTVDAGVSGIEGPAWLTVQFVISL